MRVSHVIHSLGAGGAERVLLDLAHVASYGDFEMSVVSLTGEVDAVNAAALARIGVPVRSLGLDSRWDPRAFPRLHRTLHDLAPEVVHTHLKHADIVGAYAARRRRIPHVSTLHVIEDTVTPGLAVKRWLAGQVRARLADCTIAVSQAQRSWYLEQFGADPESVAVVYNGVLPPPEVDQSRRAELRAGLDLRPDDVLAAMVALMRPGKGHDDLLAAVRLLPDSTPLRVVLVGDGEEGPRLRRAVAADPVLSERVRFAGYREDVPELLGAVDLVVHPSHADALPTALIHAISCGVPIVATGVGGIPEIVGRNGSAAGVLVPVAAPDLLAQALVELASDPELRARLGAAGRDTYTATFEARQWAERVGGLYRELVSARAGSARA